MFETIDLSNRTGNGFENLTGKRFGKLVVLGLSPRKSGRKSYWVCQCDCGNKKVVRSDSLKGESIRSCGCIKKEQDRINLTVNRRHKESGTRLYHEWQGIKARCSHERRVDFMDYGGRGIKVCDEWKDSYEAFANWARSNGYTDELTIERLDVNGDYESSNCTWIPHAEQANNRRSNILVEWENETLNLTQWATKLDLPHSTIRARYNRGKRPPELFLPLNKKYMPKYVTWNGKTKNLAEWAREFGLNKKTVAGRYERGIKPPELFEPVKNKTTPR